MLMNLRFLHETAPGMFWLDHRLTPEVSAMLCAMASRAPAGGVKARYLQIVNAICADLWSERRDLAIRMEHREEFKDMYKETWTEAHLYLAGHPVIRETLGEAEKLLCEYPLHPKVQKFFDDFVGKYGHSSILELTGRPAVYAEGISWLTAWLLFDSPLCAGQEFSTRAVQHKDWPMARECDGHPELVSLHNDWFEVFEAEVAWWKAEFTSACSACAGKGGFKDAGFPGGFPCAPCQGTGKKYPTADKEPFRPALDRARWALPGTIATGCAQTTALRERSRVLRDGTLLAQSSKAGAATQVWQDMVAAYREALPGLEGMGLREAVYGESSQIPGHLATLFSSAPEGPDAEIECLYTEGLSDVRPFKRSKEKSYTDPLTNTVYQTNVGFRCSLAVARDWHRHRTMYPWHLQVVRKQHLTAFPGPIQIDPHYKPMSALGISKVPELIERSTRVFDAFMDDRNLVQAALALPLGTRVRIRGQGGLRDALYMIELRKFAHGANFEYQDQATKILDLLQAALSNSCLPVGDENLLVSEVFGLFAGDL
jgi:hypothetical protein